jgi:hypothetical protein
MSDAPETPAEPVDAPAEESGGGGDAAPAKPKKVKHSGCLTAITPATTPGCAGCLSAVFLITTVATVWTMFLFDPDNVPWRHSMSAWRIGLITLLVILIPIVLYKTVQWFLEGERAKYPDVDYAWQAGLQALAANGISPASAPLFVILGSSSERQEKALLADIGMKLRVEGVPEGPAALHWYAGKDAIYLFLSDVSWTSALASLREELVADARSKGLKIDSATVIPTITADAVRAAVAQSAIPQPPTTPQPVVPPMPTAPAAPRPQAPPSVGSSPVIGGTMMLESSMMQELMAAQAGGASAPNILPGPAPSPSAEPSGSFALSQPAIPAISQSTTFTASFERNELESAGIEPVLVAPQYSASSLKQLQYVGGLLRQVRSPVTPTNGVLALLQFESIHASRAEVDELQQALQADLATLQYSTQVRAPVTALIVGLENERGFRELVRRVGKDRAATQRFGRKFDVRAYPSREQMAALAAHVGGAFEDWAYALFREENALTRPGNTRLYELLSKVRSGWQMQLAAVLAASFGSDATKTGRQDSLLFSGCYLAATGDTPDRRAFARGVIDKLNDEQELVEWDRDSLRSNRRQATLAAIGVLATLFLLFSLVAMFVLARFR